MDHKQFEILLHDAEVKLKRLKALYEQWFQGVERIEPQVARKDLDRLFETLKKEQPRNTAARFRLQQLQARYNVYVSYWQRIARQIEEGTYERDLHRAQRRRHSVESAPREVKTYELDETAVSSSANSLDDEIAEALSALGQRATDSAPATAPRGPLSAFSPFAMRSSAPPRAPTVPPAHGSFQHGPPHPAPLVTARFGKPPVEAPSRGPIAPTRPKAVPPPPPRSATRPQPVSSPSPPRSDDARLKRLYDEYIAARRRNNERVDHLRYERMAESVRKMQAKLREKHGNKTIDFEVVVQNGRVGLKPKIH